ncbi:MAG: hypothetical protein MSG64_13795 [Pyrinomonadaceae bacterium MAG19_C2-C3]|nr:hypothetical protein [Pyrinomonadaceae bacterium MAG19_C2-C3]
MTTKYPPTIDAEAVEATEDATTPTNQRAKNEAAIRLLDSWGEPTTREDEAEQRETWDYLKRVLGGRLFDVLKIVLTLVAAIVTTQPSSDGFPEGRIDQPFDGWRARLINWQGRFNVLLSSGFSH